MSHTYTSRCGVCECCISDGCRKRTWPDRSFQFREREFQSYRESAVLSSLSKEAEKTLTACGGEGGKKPLSTINMKVNELLKDVDGSSFNYSNTVCLI